MTGGFFDEDPFGLPPAPAESVPNAPPEYSVSDISNKLKRIVEDEFSFVRVRGEISKVTIAKSGHMYTALKDESAVLDAVCWKGTVARLGITPAEGMEVVVTGRLTTYPGRSNYQMIIETMELAGQGALLKMLEDRKKKLAAEGLFDAARKKDIPFLPDVIGVITSPTGAVIRDIMHRLDERFPRRVLLWPVIVQGQNAARQVAEAINGFNSIPANDPLRPDVLIVARGGGSLEDLMPFNDEIVVRAAAASAIPLISAVGHETDTTLIDFAADLRAPTPTAAAEKAVPVRRDILAAVVDSERRIFSALRKKIDHHRVHLTGLVRGLGQPQRILESIGQKMDLLSQRLDSGLINWLAQRKTILSQLSAKTSPAPLRQRLKSARQFLTAQEERLLNTRHKITTEKKQRLESAGALLNSLSFERVLERGYAVIFDETGDIVSSAKTAEKKEKLKIRFRDGTLSTTTSGKAEKA